MKNKKENTFSRLLNVLGIIVIGLSIYIIITVGCNTLSERDDYNSFIRCESGKEYNLDTLRTSFGVLLMYNEKEFNPEENEKVKALCRLTDMTDSTAQGILSRLDSSSLNQIVSLNKTPENKNYYLFLHKVKEDGADQWVIMYCILGIIGSYITVNSIREVILYIFFGKKISKDILKPFN